MFLAIFSVFQKIWFLGILGPPSYGIGATISIGREMLCLAYAGFLFQGVTCEEREYNYIPLTFGDF